MFIICSKLKEKDKMSCLSFLTEVLHVPSAKQVYSAHWIQRLASVTGVEVAIDSAVAIYAVTEVRGSWGSRSLYPRSLYQMGAVLFCTFQKIKIVN